MFFINVFTSPLPGLLAGSNTGIGREAAVDLARRGARVILACRSIVRAEAALAIVKRVRKLTFIHAYMHMLMKTNKIMLQLGKCLSVF